MELQDFFRRCRVEDGIIRLPEGQLDRKDYLQVKKVLEGKGGKWKGGKVQGFVFSTDAGKVLASLAGGDMSDTKKKFQFYATPDDVADRLAVRLGDLEPTYRILEPSAGTGSLVNAVHRLLPDAVVDCYELMPENRELLERLDGIRLLGDDFMTSDVGMYDRIIANPPFTKNQDIAHVRRMWEHLAPGGQMAVIMSTHFEYASDKASKDFREFLEGVDHDVTHLAKGTFRQSGTDVETVMLVMWK